MQKVDLHPGNPITFTKDKLLQRRIEAVLDGLEWTAKHLFSELKDVNKKTVVDFLSSLADEKASSNTKRAYISNLVLLSRYYEHKKSFREFTREDIRAWLQTYQRTPSADPKEKWINTFNQKTLTISKFFKWLYFPDLPKDERKKVEPDVIKNLPLFKRKERTSVQVSDLWLPEEDKIFLRYCQDPRLCLYHTMADDTSGRPHELLNRRFNDVKIKQYDGRTYGEVEIGRGGKTKARTVPLITSIPYFKQWQAQNDDPNQFIFRALSQRALYKNKPLTTQGIGRLYRDMKQHFKTLLERPDLPQEDKVIIGRMLEKPWNPYIRRHASLTRNARLVNEYNLRQHAGWSKNSKMIEIYTHELGGESCKDLLAAHGIIPNDVQDKREILQAKVCPNCGEPNKPDARFCTNIPKCGMPLTFDAFREQKEKEKEKENEIKNLREETDKKIESMKEEFKDIIQGFVMKYTIRDNKTDDPRFFQSLLNGSEEVRKDGRFDAMLERVKSDIAARKKAIEDLYEKGGELPEVRLANGNFIPAMCILPKKKAPGTSPKN